MDATEELETAAGGGLVLGRYRLGRRLGSGGFGTVFAARDERLDRPVAVKAVPAQGPVPERAQREALAAARLDHPGIVAVFDAGEEGGERFLISELVRGRTLAALEREGALSDRDVLRAGLSLADALAHAHARGVIHRDVKPQNVIVPDEPGRVAAKLLDFGVAHLAGDEPLTRTGDVVGTLAYMAPEQAAGERVDERADLYSLALVLYEALSGTNPVRMPSPAATARRVGTVLPPLRKARRDLPAELCAALDRALAPDAEARGTLPELAGALATALNQVSDEGGTIAPHPLEGGERRVGLLARVAAGAAAGALVAAALSAADLPPLAGALVAALAVVAFPRAGWLVAAGGAAAALAEPEPDTAALVAVGAVLPPLLLRRRGLLWSLPALAPVLGLAGLAGGYPAIAGRVRGLWARAALGACGLCWLLLAEPLLGRDLLLGPPPSDARDVLATLASSGALVLAAVWAVAAAVLPWLVRGRSVSVDVVGATTWAAALAAATGAVAESMALGDPRGLVAGALLAGALALIGARARDTVNTAHDRP